MVSMKDVAVECGVSIATVSKASMTIVTSVKRHAGKLKRQLTRLGYYPNSAARALKTNRSYNIGVLLNNGLAHEYLPRFLRVLRMKQRRRGMILHL
ncbi:MAG: hypothetical protein ACLS9K_06135 [Lachnospira eligens]